MSDKEAQEPAQHPDAEEDNDLINGSDGGISDADDEGEEEEEAEAQSGESSDEEDVVVTIKRDILHKTIFENSLKHDSVLDVYLYRLRNRGVPEEALMAMFTEREDSMKDEQLKAITRLYGSDLRGDDLRTKLKEILEIESDVESESDPEDDMQSEASCCGSEFSDVSKAESDEELSRLIEEAQERMDAGVFKDKSLEEICEQLGGKKHEKKTEQDPNARTPAEIQEIREELAFSKCKCHVCLGFVLLWLSQAVAEPLFWKQWRWNTRYRCDTKGKSLGKKDDAETSEEEYSSDEDIPLAQRFYSQEHITRDIVKGLPQKRERKPTYFTHIGENGVVNTVKNKIVLTHAEMSVLPEDPRYVDTEFVYFVYTHEASQESCALFKISTSSEGLTDRTELGNVVWNHMSKAWKNDKDLETLRDYFGAVRTFLTRIITAAKSCKIKVKMLGHIADINLSCTVYADWEESLTLFLDEMKYCLLCPTTRDKVAALWKLHTEMYEEGTEDRENADVILDAIENGNVYAFGFILEVHVAIPNEGPDAGNLPMEVDVVDGALVLVNGDMKEKLVQELQDSDSALSDDSSGNEFDPENPTMQHPFTPCDRIKQIVDERRRKNNPPSLEEIQELDRERRQFRRDIAEDRVKCTDPRVIDLTQEVRKRIKQRTSGVQVEEERSPTVRVKRERTESAPKSKSEDEDDVPVHKKHKPARDKCDCAESQVAKSCKKCRPPRAEDP